MAIKVGAFFFDKIRSGEETIAMNTCIAWHFGWAAVGHNYKTKILVADSGLQVRRENEIAKE